MTRAGATRCAAHPNIETNLRCGKCGKPICPRCMVQTPVGARCRQCARPGKAPTFRVSGWHYLRAAGTGLGLAIVIGVAWSFIEALLPFFFFSLILAAGIGWVIGELVSLSVNRKRGVWLAVIGGLAVVLCYGVSLLVEYLISGHLAITLFRAVFALLGLGIGVYFAVNRLR